MEFILISSPNLQNGSQLLGPLLSDAPLKNPKNERLKFYSFDGLFFAATDMEADEISAIGFDGSAIDNNRAYNSKLKRPPAHAHLVSYLDGTLGRENKSSLRGNFCAVRLNPHTRAFNIVTDPLSAYPLAICGFGETFIVSNNIDLVETAVKAFGLSLSRTSKSLALGLIFGVSPGNRTGFREVAQLPPGKLITGIGPNWRIIDQAPVAMPTFASGKEKTSALCERLSRNIGFSTSLLDEDPSVHQSANAQLVPSLLTDGSAFDSIADDYEQQWRVRDAMGRAIMTQECLLRPQNIPTLSAVFDFSLLARDTAAKSGSLFWQSPFKNLMAFSNNDPLYFAALASRYKGGGSRISAHALSLARLRNHDLSFVRRSFLRQGMQTMIEDLSKADGGQSDAFLFNIESTRMRQETLVLAADNHRAPAFAPFLDPWFSSVSAGAREGDISGDLFDKVTKLLPTKPPRNAPSKPKHYVDELRRTALGIGETLPAHSECWNMLDRKKTLSMLQSQKHIQKRATLYSGLVQIFYWAAG